MVVWQVHGSNLQTVFGTHPNFIRPATQYSSQVVFGIRRDTVFIVLTGLQTSVSTQRFTVSTTSRHSVEQTVRMVDSVTGRHV